MPRLRLRLQLPLLLCLLMVTVGGATAQGNFEDADKANEYTDQQYDLRHTIPGEPGLDYPILGEVPKTSFICKGRHEGYYADVESRCQAFRICAHTARNAQGFGFLCPNGTIFSQQKFVCDWYRNVDCDQSERYYDMNRDTSVGSTQQMMERVRQMMEYPTKTISQALQDHAQHKTTHQKLSKDLSHESGVLKHVAKVNSGNYALRGEDIKSEALPGPATSADAADSGEDIYVNSLGELSSDPGIQFDHTNAHIIAEYPREYHYMKQKNFAERVNAGLELLSDTSAASDEQMAPDFIKQIRNTNEEAVQKDLVSNINNLLDELSTDLDPSVSGYQTMTPQLKVKQPFRFLSRGFTTNSKTAGDKDGSKGSSSYVYNKPKQTLSTVRFTPNDIPVDAQKDFEIKQKLSNNDKTTSTTTTTITDMVTEPIEVLLIAPELPPEFEEDFSTSTTMSYTTEAAPVAPSQYNELPIIESIGQAAALTAGLTLSDNLQLPQNEPLGAAAADKSDVDMQAEKLLLAGVKLTSHDEESALRTNKLTLGRPVNTTTTTARPITTPAMKTSTETVTEMSSTQERIRSYRRFAQKRVGGSGGALRRQANYSRSTASTTSRSTTSTANTTQRSTTATRSYAERLAASRSRLTRLSLATKLTTTTPTTAATAISKTSTILTTTTTTTGSPLSYVRSAADQGPNKKISVRDIEKETGQQRASWDSVQSNLQRFQVQRGNRVYTPATRSTTSSSKSISTTSSTKSISSTLRPVANTNSNKPTTQRARNRHSNYRTQPPQQRTRGTTTPRSTTKTALSTLSQQISAIANGYSYTPALLNSLTHLQTHNHNNAPTTAQTQTVSGTQKQQQLHEHQQQQQLSQTTSSLNPSSAFLPFDKLTRAIVDDSILQNFKSSHAQNTNNANTYSSNNSQQQQQRIAKPTTSNSYHYIKPAAAETPTPALTSLNIPPIPQQQQQEQPKNPQQQQLPQKLIRAQPGIVIARAEGQRIAPNSASSIISTLVNQPHTKSTQSNSYVALSDFITNKFGQPAIENVNVAGPATLQQQRQQQNVQQNQQQLVQQQHKQQPQQVQEKPHQQTLQQQHRHQQQPQSLQQQSHSHQHQQQQQQHQHQQQKLSYISQRYQQQPQQVQHYNTQQQYSLQQHQPHHQQQHHQQSHFEQINYQPQFQQQHHQQQRELQHQQQLQHASIQSIQQPYLTPHIFVPYQQQQQHLPLFPPLVGAAPTKTTRVAPVAGPSHQVDHFNVPLPALPNGLIPAPIFQVAQKRSDVKINQLQLTSSKKDRGQESAFYAGRTSYEVPQSSVGRLPNDVTHLRRLRQRRY